MRCREVREKLAELSRTELDRTGLNRPELNRNDSAPETLTLHLSKCSECRRFQVLWLGFGHGAELLGRESVPEPSAAFWPRLQARLETDADRLSLEAVLERVGRKMIWASSLAALLLGLGLVFETDAPTSSETAALEAETEMQLSRTFVLEMETNGEGELRLASGEEAVGFRMNADFDEGNGR